MTRPSWLRIPFDLITILLFMAMTTAVVGSLLRVSKDDRLTVLLPLGLAGVMVGYFLARYQVSDYLAHSIALWTGLLAAMFAATTIQTSVSEIVDTRFGVYNGLLRDLVRSIFSREGSTIERNEMLVALGMVAWLVAYTSTWIYVRRGWFWLAIAGPAVVMLVALHLDEDEGVWQVSLFLISAICLAARNAHGGWQASWAQRRVPVARGMVRKLTLLILPVATVAVLLATLTAPAIHDFATNNAGQTMKEAWDSTVSNVARLNRRSGQSPQAYNSFADEIEIGKDLNLGDGIIATASLASPRYLRLRTYNIYTGSGWTTDIATTFNADGSDQGPVTKVTYQPEQTVSVSFADLVQQEGTVTVVLPMDGAVPVIDQFSSADQQVFALMSWQQIDNMTYDVNAINLNSVPIDVRGLVDALQGEEFEVDDKTGDVSLTDPAAQKKFEEQQQAVAAYPIVATLDVGDDGNLLLRLTGRLPIYDDIEKVLTKAEDGNPGTYRVTGSTSAATVAQLQQAGKDYPVWVTDRYLQLPDTVTQRTRDLATNLVIGYPNPYDQATAIESFLRTNFAYELNSPDFDGDAVDHFLFEHQAGRCEQFAAAMVVMLRSVGIPSRLVSGYRVGSEIDDGDYVYRANQAHQWVEIYVPTYGWIEFEPTTNQLCFSRDDLGAETVDTDTTPVPDESTPKPVATPEITPEPTVAVSPIPPTLDLPESGGGGSAGWMIAMAIGLATIAAAVALGAFNWAWRTRGLSETGSLLYRLQRVGGWFGIHPTSSTTPAEYAARFGERFPPAASSAKSISDAYYHETFGPPDARPDLVDRAENGWSRIRATVWRTPFQRRSVRKDKRHS